MQQSLLDFFLKIASRDRQQLQLLSLDSRFQLDACCWHFNLPDLYRHLAKYDRIFSTMSYPKFRKALYNCPVQQIITNYGARVTITDNQRNVDKSTYTLVWSEHTNDVVS